MPPLRLLPLALALLALVFGTNGCSPSGSYEVRGRVAGFSDDPRTVIVEHEPVDGYMPAMTMPFTARSADPIVALEPGDALAFTMHVNGDSTWIDDVRTLPDDAVARHPAGEQPAPTRGGGTLLARGATLPPFTLVDAQGDSVRASDYEGRALALTFIYTRCPLPTYCPLMSERFRTLQPRLRDRYGDEARLLSISFDPAHDTPAVLADYAQRYDADPDLWSFATGDSTTIQRLTGRFGVYVQPQGGAQGAFVHNLTTAVVGPDGRIHRIWYRDEWSPDDVVAAIDDALGRADGQDETAGAQRP